MAHLANKAYIDLELQQKLFDRFIHLYNLSNCPNINICVVGGSALQWKYGKELRNLTFDIDASFSFSVPSAENIKTMNSIIKQVSEEMNVEEDWLNSDFRNSMSYSREIIMDAIRVEFKGKVGVFVVSDLTQICMKLTSSRNKDIEDVKNLAFKLKNNGVSFDTVIDKFNYLYKGKVEANNISLKIIKKALK